MPALPTSGTAVPVCTRCTHGTLFSLLHTVPTVITHIHQFETMRVAHSGRALWRVLPVGGGCCWLLSSKVPDSSWSQSLVPSCVCKVLTTITCSPAKSKDKVAGQGLTATLCTKARGPTASTACRAFIADMVARARPSRLRCASFELVERALAHDVLSEQRPLFLGRLARIGQPHNL